MSVAASEQLIYEFSEGSKDMRDLLGGKGANVAEMTRVLGADKVPAGFAPELASCASCGETKHLGAFSPGAGGVVCAGCEAGSFPLGNEAHAFMVAALARPLSEAPGAPELALSQADRALAETLEHHAHVRLRRVA